MKRELLRHPRIHTGDGTVVTGVLVEDGRIVAVGDADALLAQVAHVAVTDLPGAAVFPGFFDAHLHSASLARDLDALDLRNVATEDECLEAIAAHLATRSDQGWLMDARWDSNRWSPPGPPNRYALDRVCPDRPAVLPSIDGHSAWVNSAALARAGITATTPNPPGGVIVRDERGEATGILQEEAIDLVRDIANAERVDTPDLLRSRLLRAQEYLLSVGLTSVHDIDGEDARAAYLTMMAEGELAIRVHKALPMSALDQAIAEGRRTGEGNDWFTNGPVKLFSDGALGSHTCLMSADFVGHPGHRGVPVVAADELAALTRRAVDAGIGVAIHAIGDRANEVTLDAFEQAAPYVPDHLKLRIEHAQYLRPVDIKRMASLGVVASMQPIHCPSDYELTDRMLAGHDLIAYPWRSLSDAGALLAFGSDAPVESPNPFWGLHAAVTRTRADGTPPGGWRIEEALTLGEALAAYTTGSARACGLADKVGRLRPGALADLVAVDTDLLAVTPDQIRTAEVQTTVVGGQIRWSHP